jgi:phosphoribosylaminoimidazolecarboxamide formyltransferase/IMP cyclohydrolase
MQMKALLSVSDKKDIVTFARSLIRLGYELLATPGTARALSEHNVPSVNIGKSDSWPPYALIERRQLVTYTRSIHAALMIDTRNRITVTKQHGLWIDLLCLNLLPLEAALPHQFEKTELPTLETIDLGGTALLKSAIKGKRIIVCDPADYPRVISWLQQGMPDEALTIARMGRKALGLIRSRHDAISEYLHAIAPNSGETLFPDS